MLPPSVRRKIRVVVRREGAPDRSVEIERFPAVLGRAEHCAVQVLDPGVSREHAEIAEVGDRVLLVDRGSRNGTRLNDVAVAEAELNDGDEIAVGAARITVTAGAGRRRRTSSEGERNRLGTRLSRRRRFVSIGPVLGAIIALCVAALVFLVVRRDQTPQLRVPDAAELRVAAATEELRRFQGVVAQAPRVTPSLLREARDLAFRHQRVDFPGGARPFDDELAQLRARHEIETGNRLYELLRRRDELVERRAWGDLWRLVEEDTEDLLANAPARRDDIARVREQSRARVEAGLEAALLEARYLEGLAQTDECGAYYERTIEAFSGTPFRARVEEAFGDYRKRLEHARRAREARLAARREAAKRRREAEEAARRASAAKPATRAEILASTISGAGEGRSRPLRLSEFRGCDVDVRDGHLVATTPEGEEKRTPLARLRPATLVEVAASCLRGDDLLELARFALSEELDEHVDSLLVSYLRDKGLSTRTADREVEKILVEARELDRVPDGGFTYSQRHGWEDARQTAERIALEQAEKLARKLSSTSSESALEKSFGEARALLDDSTLSGSARGSIRGRVLQALGSQREKVLSRLRGSLASRGFARLRLAREELDRRRAKALEVIYDTAVYLPEGHPDWPKGDETNGQAAVDEAVQRVRELWDGAGEFAISIDPRAARLVQIVRRIDEEYFPKLHHQPDGSGRDELEELLSNLDRVVDLRRFARNQTELQTYEYNRKVEAYNRSLEDPDLTDDEKAHVAFVNDYREMLGRRRLFLDVRLCRATSKHSEACDKANRIWHDGPDGSPSSRARAEGFPTGVAENVAIGYSSPKDIWSRGWYRASDHHRIALGAGSTCMGYGYHGRVGTQNFARIAAPFR